MRNLEDRLPDAADRAWFGQPALLARLLERGSLGEKTGRGFYERRKDAAGKSAVFTLDPATLDYQPQKKPHASRRSRRQRPSTTPPPASARSSSATTRWVSSCARRSRRRCSTPRASHPTSPTRIDDVDRVMRWGFGWELGPFETLDAIGLREVVEAASAAGVADVPPLIAEALDSGHEPAARGPRRRRGRAC